MQVQVIALFIDRITIDEILMGMVEFYWILYSTNNKQFIKGFLMKITVSESVSSPDEMYICAVDADIEINFDLTSIASKITIIGKNVIIDATLMAPSAVMVVGLKLSKTTPRGVLHATGDGSKATLGAAELPHPSFAQGVHISPNLIGRVTIT